MGFSLYMVWYTLFMKWPSGDVGYEDFLMRLTPDNNLFWLYILGIAVNAGMGFAVYIIPTINSLREHAGPIPHWLHCLYCAGDFMGIWVFLQAWIDTHFWFFLMFCVAEAVWTGLEIWFIHGAFTWERDIVFPADSTFKENLANTLIMIFAFFVALNILRVYLHDFTMWKFWLFTNILITVAPPLYLQKRKTRIGGARCWYIILVCICFDSYLPVISMWHFMAPQFFAPSENIWIYLVFPVVLWAAIRGLRLYNRLPEKPAIIDRTGKPPIFK